VPSPRPRLQKQENKEKKKKKKDEISPQRCRHQGCSHVKIIKLRGRHLCERDEKFDADESKLTQILQCSENADADLRIETKKTRFGNFETQKKPDLQF
jgi:hypothetical protein